MLFRNNKLLILSIATLLLAFVIGVANAVGNQTGDLNWYIDEVGVEVNFDDESDDNELEFIFNVSKQTTQFAIKEQIECDPDRRHLLLEEQRELSEEEKKAKQDAKRMLQNALVGSDSESPQCGTHFRRSRRERRDLQDDRDLQEAQSCPPSNFKDYLVDVDIKQDLIVGSPFYNEGSTRRRLQGEPATDASIDFCLRVDQIFEGPTANYSANFYETQISIMLDMTKGFDIVGVSTSRINASTTTAENVTLDYYIDAFETDDAGNDLTGTGKQYTQGDFLEIGIKTNSTSGVKVANIIDMTLVGDETLPAVANGAPANTLTEMDCSSSSPITDGCYTKTMLVSNFFQNADPAPITASGTCVMEFQRARRLSSFVDGYIPSNAPRRSLQQGDDEQKFDLQVSLQPMTFNEDDVDIYEHDSAAASSSVVIGGMVSFVVTAIVTFFF